MSLELEAISHSYKRRGSVLESVSLSLEAGQSTALVAPSGFGKSTLLAIAGLLLTPTAGVVRIGGSVAHPRDASALLRSGDIGWITQLPRLLTGRSAVDNVLVAALPRGQTHREATPRARQLVRQVGLHPDDERGLSTYSGGELQRIAVARALMAEPLVLIADEPTANLDRANADLIANAILQSGTRTAVLLATHDPLVATQANRVFAPDGHGRFVPQ